MKWSGGFNKINKMLGKQYSTFGVVKFIVNYANKQNLSLLRPAAVFENRRQEKRSYK